VVAAEFVSSIVDSGNEVESCPVQSGNSPYYVCTIEEPPHTLMIPGTNLVVHHTCFLR